MFKSVGPIHRYDQEVKDRQQAPFQHHIASQAEREAEIKANAMKRNSSPERIGGEAHAKMSFPLTEARLAACRDVHGVAPKREVDALTWAEY